ncbi:hypothetical protein [Roseibium sp.]|uniref:hypothetical protein n=1 Tax=Roseibium sp. TaxID=1936156 RepID=UPI003A97C8E4
MLSGLEISRALQGCWLLFRNRPEGMGYFDVSIEGFWRSFRVVFLLVPLFIISSMSERRLIIEETNILAENFPENAYWMAQFTSLGVDWIALPLLLAALSAPLGVSRGYVPFVIARNWSSLVVAAPYVIVGLLYLSGVIAPGIMVLLSLATLVVMIWYRYQVTRIALQAAVGTTIGVVVLDIILSLVIGEVAGRIFGV